MHSFVRFKKSVLALLALSLASAFAPAHADASLDDKTEIGQKLNLPIYKWADSSVKTKAVVVAVHGATLYAKRFDTTARHLAEEGFPVYAMDLRGFGQWRVNGETFADGDRKIHYSRSENDLVDMLKAVRESNPGVKMFCLGESLGANVAIWVGSHYPELADGLVLVSPCIKGSAHIGPRFVFDIIFAVLHPNKELRLARHIKPYLSDDPAVTAEYLSDPGIYHNFTGVDLVKCIKTNSLSVMAKDRIPADMPVLVVAGKIDKIYKASAIPPFVDGMGSKLKTIAIIPDRGHLLLESSRVKSEVLSIIDNWLQNGDRSDSALSLQSTADANIETFAKTR